MIKIQQKGEFKNLQKFLEKAMGDKHIYILERYAKQGVAALSAATPKDTGKTASSWYYEIKKEENGWSITWNNSNVNKYVNIAMILQYGHATRNGGYVSGIDYINPAMRPIFEKMAKSAWEEVTSI